jgi:hypothetical protein
MGSQDIHTFFKLLKVTYENYAVNITKSQACSLYKFIHRFIECRKRKGENKIVDIDSERE